ncbi:protein kinase domain-containing protein [Paenibacillus sp. 1P07SE]|uniref:protein kinase domain-containing protein n=1 Tax=Paenibacillus sp. 1P07SE TaxID=3132209 RepID=UPI0039A5DBB7
MPRRTAGIATIPLCARITLQLLELVDYMHSHGYVHLDLRIPNVLFHDERLLLIDFGLARRIGEPPDAEFDPRSLWDRWFTKVRSKPAKEAKTASDLEDTGHFMLYMLYSSYEPDAAVEGQTTEQAQEPSWQEELQLSPEMRLMVERLFRLQPHYPDAASFIKELRKFVTTRETP